MSVHRGMKRDELAESMSLQVGEKWEMMVDECLSGNEEIFK